MKHSLIKTHKGIGLIEVLITTVVIAVGLLAVASLQGKFVSSSGTSKTRSEAVALAEQKLEQIKNNVTISGYNTVFVAGPTTVADAGNPIAGTNASFTRSWIITDVDPPVPPFNSSSPKLKRISVRVGWDANGDGDSTDADEVVNVVTEVAWVDPAKASQYAAQNASGGTSSVASPRQNASEDVASEGVTASSPTPSPMPGSVTATLVGGALPSSIAVTGTDGGAYTITRITDSLPATHYYATTFGNGVIAVFLCDDSGTCTYIQNHFGGVVNRIAGTVHSTSSNGFTNIKVAWTSSSVSDCYNGPVTVVTGTGTNQYRYRPYECIYAGNCNATADGVNRCYADTLVSDTQINNKHVGPGGEYGDVGLLGVDDQGGDREQVCFLEDTADPTSSPILNTSGGAVLNENYLYSVTKRFYAARRVKRNGSINDQKTEGINHSFTNHNFLIVPRGSGGTANQTCNLKAAAHNIQLAPREIFKLQNEGTPNTVEAEASYTGAAGTAKTFTGTVTGSATKLKLIIPELGGCYLNNNSGSSLTAYACVVPPGTSSVDIKGASNEHPSLNPSVFASCTKTDATTCNWLANFSGSATPSADCTAPWGATVTSGTGVTAYQNALEPYGGSCTSQTRNCSGTPGALSGSYLNQACTVATSPDCASPFAGGSTITNGGNVNAYSTASVPAGTTCPAPVNRVCTNGILSGSGNYSECNVQTDHTITVSTSSTGTGTVSGITVTGSGASCVGLVCTVSNTWTGTLTATGTCSGGGSVSGTSATIPASTGAVSTTISLGTCNGPTCTLPWGGTIASGGSVTAYQTSSVVSPTPCASELRFCTDGVLGGTYTNQSCTVTHPSCTLGGATVASGTSITTGYPSATVAYPSTCTTQSALCTDGVFSPAVVASCTRVCTVPSINGMSTTNAANITAVNNAITSAGFVVGTTTDTGAGTTKVVSAQSPAAGTTSAACGSAISYHYH